MARKSKNRDMMNPTEVNHLDYKHRSFLKDYATD